MQDNLAVKSLHKTIWRDWFYTLFGIDPNQDIDIHYDGPAHDTKNVYSLTFDERRAAYLGDVTVKTALEHIYAPKLAGLKRAK